MIVCVRQQTWRAGTKHPASADYDWVRNRIESSISSPFTWRIIHWTSGAGSHPKGRISITSIDCVDPTMTRSIVRSSLKCQRKAFKLDPPGDLKYIVADTNNKKRFYCSDIRSVSYFICLSCWISARSFSNSNSSGTLSPPAILEMPSTLLCAFWRHLRKLP